MAGDWIKMRGALLDNPKVIAITRALHANREFRNWLTPGGGGPMNGQVVSVAASRCVTVALLMRVWSSAREHGKFVGDDLVLPFSEIADLDQMAGAPGVGQAMLDVEWARELDGVTLPNFKEFNVPMTPAERAKGYRERNASVTTQSLNEGDGNAVIVTPREEKRREEELQPQQIGASGLPIEPSNIPYKEIMALHNEHMTAIPRVIDLTAKRKQLIRAAWQASKTRRALKFWKAYFEECAEDDFLNGTGPYGKGHENWRPSFDYLMKNDVITRVYEKAMSRGE